MLRITMLLASAALLVGLAAAPSHAALIARYSGDNTAIDATGNGHDGTVTGATYSPGVFGDAFTFDGTGDMVLVPASTDLEPPQFSVAFWVKSAIENHLRVLIDSTHGAGQAGWALQLNTANNISFAHGNGVTFPELVLGAGLGDGEFHHIAATFDGTTMKLYADGGSPVSLAYTGTPAPSGRDIQIGHSPVLGRPFEGALDEIRIYNHALSPAEVARLASVPEPTTAGLLALALAGVATWRVRRQ